MKLILAIPAVGLICSGALSFTKLATSHPKTVPAITLTTPTIPEPKDMWVSSDPVFKGEKIALHFNTPNAMYLGVINPDGKFFYVVFPSESAIGNLQPLVSSEKFTDMRTLEINTATLKADPYAYGVYDNQAVFTKSGTYRFVLGDNLHVDDEEGLKIVKVKYKHSARPAVAFAG